MLLFGVVLALAVGQLVYYYPRLPETVASHFDAGGRADDSMSTQMFFTFMAVITGMTALMTLVISYAAGQTSEGINLPNKAYWLAPERREATLEYLSRTALVFGTATLALLVVMMHLSFRANFSPERSMGNAPWVVMLAYLGFLAVWIGRVFWRFRKPA